jgi:DNA polymerase-3 subunit beta
MDLTLSRTAILDELQLLQGVLDRRTTIPILANILCSAEGDRLRLAATDLDITLLTSCPATIRQEGQTTVPGKTFFDLIRALPTESVEITTTDSRLEIRSGTFQSQIACLNPGDYPTLPEVPTGQGFALPVDLLHNLIDATSFAVSAEEGHFQYNAALLLLPGDRVELVATDGHRLAYGREPHTQSSPPFEQQLIPRKVMSQIRRFTAEAGMPLYLGRGENHLAFRLGERVLLSRVLEARFPQYDRVLVRDNPHRLVVLRSELMSALRRVALLTSERTRAVQLHVDEDALSLNSHGFDLGQAAEIVPCRYSGPPLSLLVNSQYILDFLGAVEYEEVQFQLREQDGPVVLTPVLPADATGEYLYVIMPIRL